MESNRDLLKEAIADAKAVKETALAQAKVALEEAFTPFLKETLATRIAALDEVDDVEENMYMDDIEEGEYMEEGDKMEMEEGDGELDLEALLAELDEEKSDASELEEEDLEELYEAEEDEEDDEDFDDDDDEDKEFNVEDMSEKELADFIGEVVQELIDSKELVFTDPNSEMEEEPGMKMTGAEEEIDIDEILAEAAKEKMKRQNEKMSKKDEKEESKELKEAYDTIQTLRNELNEINLLNAKLLYTNKIFKAKSLTESEKVKVLSAFDKAVNVKEVKLVYESLMVNSNKTKSSIKESLGSASKVIAQPETKQSIIEVNEAFSRMQKLAGLK
jgi:hypothetical protein